ncbi:zinc finger, CCHC-type containing protein [Tanacetum coccineum]
MVVGDQIPTSGIRAQVKHRKARWEYCTKAWRFKVGFKQLGPGVEAGIHEVHDEKRVLFGVELQGAHGDREAEVFQVSNDDTAVAQRWLEDKQPKKKTNTDCLVKEQEKECQTGWKIKMGNVLDSCNQRSTQQCTKSGVAKHLGVAGLQQQNGLVKETNVTLLAKRLKTPIDMLGFFGWLASIKQGMLEPVKVKCIFLGYRKGIVGNKLWRLDDVTSKVVLYRNMGFNESGEYKKTFIGSGVGTGSMQVLQGDEFEVEPQDGHTFEVEPHGNVNHVVGSQEVQTQDLIYYHPARDREQHSVWELFKYREDSNEAAFAVAEAEKIYAHESLTFNNTVACEVISKWKAGLKDDMDARSDVYVLSNGCKKCSDDSDGYYWESTPGDCDVEKNGKWSCIYAAVSVVSRYLANPGKNHWEAVKWILKYLRDYAKDPDKGRSITGYAFLVQGCIVSWKKMLQHVVALSTTEAEYMALTEAVKEAIWLRGLLEELGVELNTVVVNCDNQGAIHLSRNHVFHERTKHINVRYYFIREVLEAKTVKVLKVGTEHNAADALTKVVPGRKLQHCLELLSVGIG